MYVGRGRVHPGPLGSWASWQFQALFIAPSFLENVFKREPGVLGAHFVCLSASELLKLSIASCSVPQTDVLDI